MMRIREREAETDRCRLAWLEAGSGWPVILLHAYPLTADMWRPQLERVPTSCRLIAPDLRGFAASAPVDPARLPSIADYAADVLALLDCLEIDEAIVGGLSFGGYVSFALYRTDPSRFTGIVLADTRAAADTPEALAGRQALRRRLADGGPGLLADAMLPRLLADSTRRERPQVADEVRAMAKASAPAGLDAAMAAMAGRPDSTPLLPTIACPALIVVGDEDAITPVAEAQAMQRAIPRSTLAVIPGAGHLSNLEQPALFSRALDDFLVMSNL